MHSSRTWPSRGSRLVASTLAVVLAGACSGKPSSEPTEENIHAGDLRPVGPMTDTHVFRCGDGSRLLVQFGRGAPTISIRARPDATPVVLTASANGRPYERPGMRAVIADSNLRIELADGSHKACTRQTRV